ncbi:MAG: hypothetical protein MUP45_02480 [Candidatus Marinimicrobia bacterium]|nr:hypothetical protein [Candidatus Neomarinimicrobiota bacterium]
MNSWSLPGLGVEKAKIAPLKHLFGTWEGLYDSGKAQEDVVGALKELLNQPKLKSFLKDGEKQEFARLLNQFTGGYFFFDELDTLDEIFQHKNEVIYLAQLFFSREKTELTPTFLGDNPKLEAIIKITKKRPDLTAVFSQKGFAEFLQTLQTKAGYKLPASDIYERDESPLAKLYLDAEIRHGLTQDKTLEVIKATHPEKGFTSNYADVYLRWAEIPDIPHLFNILREIGYDFDRAYSEESILARIGQSSELVKKLEAPEIKDLAVRLRKDFKWLFTGSQIIPLINLYEDKELQKKLFTPENSEFIKKMRSSGLSSLQEIKPLLDIDSPTRELLIKLADIFAFQPMLENNSALYRREVFDNLLSNKDLRDKLFSERTVKVFKGLREKYSFGRLSVDQIEIIANVPEDFPQFISELESNYQYKFDKNDLTRILRFSAVKEKLPEVVATLKHVLGYDFDLQDVDTLVFCVENNLTRESLATLIQIYDRYKEKQMGHFQLGHIEAAALIERHLEDIKRLEKYNYQFSFRNINNLRFIFEHPEKENIFQTFEVLADNFDFSLAPNSFRDYIRLAQLPGMAAKIREASMSVEREVLFAPDNFKLFVILGANASLYNHATRLLSDEYFVNIRDAQRRLEKFKSALGTDKIPDSAAARLFALSRKATELDRLALKFQINAEIAQSVDNREWYQSLFQVENFQEADESLTTQMVSLAIPVIYPDLKGEALNRKKADLLQLAKEDNQFGDILEINCRSVGIFGGRFRLEYRQGDFETLKSAIRESLELNQERDPKAYLQKRVEISSQQFDRLFREFPQDVRDRATQSWLDLSPRRFLRVTGEKISSEESTINRLNKIKEIAQTDLAIHLQDLFLAKIKLLEQAVERGESKGPSADQLAIYKEHLLTPEGEVRQDLLRPYKSIRTFIRAARKKLRDPATSNEEKAYLGKNLGTFEAISNSIEALYRLGNITDEKLKKQVDYLERINEHIDKFNSALKRLQLLDPERRASEENIHNLEEQVLIDFNNLKEIMAQEKITDQTTFETTTTVDFRDLARAPEMNQTCQRLTESTDYNQAAYSRILDGIDEMVDIYELKEGEKRRLARSFIELSRAQLDGEDQPRLVVLFDRLYHHPQYQDFAYHFSNEMLEHMIDRMNNVPETSLLFPGSQLSPSQRMIESLKERGYQTREVSGEYFVNASNVKLEKYYDSMGGRVNVSSPSQKRFDHFVLVEKIPSPKK